jgi:AraC-like DNA-binding protein
MAESSTFQRLVRARRLIDDCFDQPLDLETIAAEACLSRYHFLRQFQREFQTTPHAYLQARRIERAKQLLATGNHSVTDVCFEVGFQSLGSFSTLFRRVVGQPPAWYRARSLIVHIPGCFIAKFGLDRRPVRRI